MTYEAFIEKFRKQVDALSAAKQLDFAITISKKLLPDYEHFSNQHKWGDLTLMTEAINLCEQARINVLADSTIGSMIQSVEAVTPDVDDYGDEIASYGLNACIAVLHTLDFLLTKDASNIFWVGNALIDTIDFKIQENEDVSDEQIDDHPLMQETQKYLLEQTQ